MKLQNVHLNTVKYMCSISCLFENEIAIVNFKSVFKILKYDDGQDENISGI